MHYLSSSPYSYNARGRGWRGGQIWRTMGQKVHIWLKQGSQKWTPTCLFKLRKSWPGDLLGKEAGQDSQSLMPCPDSWLFLWAGEPFQKEARQRRELCNLWTTALTLRFPRPLLDPTPWPTGCNAVELGSSNWGTVLTGTLLLGWPRPQPNMPSPFLLPPINLLPPTCTHFVLCSLPQVKFLSTRGYLVIFSFQQYVQLSAVSWTLSPATESRVIKTFIFHFPGEGQVNQTKLKQNKRKKQQLTFKYDNLVIANTKG